MLRITKTENGMVKGLPGTDARITVFKGIPFAADTSGKNRWRPPQPAENWEGIRECFEFAPISMQRIPGGNPDDLYSKEWNVDSDLPMSEDSLAVNVWTNANTGDEKMPVYVWIYGGGLQTGYAYEMEFDGERLASRGVVVVSISYRLNVFGFLAHPDLTKENPDAPTNFGFLDQQAAIQWVKRNIANFGGDPDNITIGGQSSGGVSVYAQMCTAANKGLFQRAVVQSSAAGSVVPFYPDMIMYRYWNSITLAEAEEFGKKFLEEYLGVKTIEEARLLDAEFIRDKYLESKAFVNFVRDGKFLTQNISEYVYNGDVNKMDLILGYTGDEYWFTARGETVEEIEAWAKESYGEYADDVIALWHKEGGDTAEGMKEASKVYLNELGTRCVAEEYAKNGLNVYCYNFDPDIPGDNVGAFHSSDLWFTFENIMKCWRPFDGHHYDLARHMCNYFANFMKNGNPNGNDKDGTPMLKWEPYSKENPVIMQFFDETTANNKAPAGFKRKLIDINNAEYYKRKRK